MFYLAFWQAFTLLNVAMPFNFNLPEFLSHNKLQKNQFSPVSQDSLAHINNPLDFTDTAVRYILSKMQL